MKYSRAQISRMIAGFRPSHFDVFRELASEEDYRPILLDEITNELLGWEDQEWVDEERISFFGRDICKASPDDFLKGLLREIKKTISNDVIKNAFFMLVEEPQLTKLKSKLPSHSEFLKLTTEIESADEHWDPYRATPILEKYIDYFRTTGDYQPVGFALDRLFQSAQQNPQLNYVEFHLILNSTVVEVFSIDATDERLWIKWASSFLKAGQYKEASLVLWDAFRRRPDSERLAFALLKVFERTKYNYQNRIRFARMAKKRFYFNRYLELEHCRLNGYSKIFDQCRDGIESLIELISKVDSVKYETVSLASILSRQWQNIKANGCVDEIVGLLNERLGPKSKLIATLAHRLNAYHGNFEAAEKILRGRISVVNDPAEMVIFQNTLAKLYASSGIPEKLDNAIEMLEAFDSIEMISSRNHLAKLLFLRNGENDWTCAEAILRENIASSGEDYYAISQLGALLMHFGNNRTSEVIELLRPHSSEDERVAELLRTIEAGEFERIDQVLDEASELQEGEALEFDPSGVGAIVDNGTIDASEVELPQDVQLNGMLRRLKFEIDYGTASSVEIARESLSNLVVDQPGEYLSFLNIEYAGKSDKRSSPGALGAKLVDSFGNSDQEGIRSVVTQIPRLSVIAGFANAILGDKAAISRIEMLREADVSAFPWERALISGVSGSKFGLNLLHNGSNQGTPSEYIEIAANENRKQFSDLVGAVVTLEAIAA